MNRKSPRVNGGIGFCIESPGIKVSATQADDFSIVDHRGGGMDQGAIERLIAAMKTTQGRCGLKKALAIEVRGEANPHCGFGTGTAIRLASLEALLLINECTVSDEELMRLSGRGGTSGIGIHTYFSGGLVIDLGRKNDGSNLVPSSQQKGNIEIPMLLQQVSMPDWNIGICIPSHIQPLTEDEEKTFFKQTCPIPENKVYQTMYYAIAGVYAAAKDNDKKAFESGIRALQECAWKKAERNKHGQGLQQLEGKLYAMGATAVGMSSLGPSLFFLADDMASVMPAMKEQLSECEFHITRPANHGRIISC